MNKIMQKVAVYGAIMALGLSSAGPAFAKGPKFLENFFGEPGSRPGLLRNFVSNRGKAAIGSCVLATKSGDTLGSTLTCTNSGKTFTLLTDSHTQLRRRFWGKATLSEMQIGDTLNVIGRWTDDSHTTVSARLIRDISIQKRFGAFFGTVKSLTGTGWVMSTLRRGDQTVTVSGSTKFVNRKGQTISQADIQVGHRVRVKGLWDRNAHTITEVTHVKDFSLPPKPTPTPTP